MHNEGKKLANDNAHLNNKELMLFVCLFVPCEHHAEVMSPEKAHFYKTCYREMAGIKDSRSCTYLRT